MVEVGRDKLSHLRARLGLYRVWICLVKPKQRQRQPAVGHGGCSGEGQGQGWSRVRVSDSSDPRRWVGPISVSLLPPRCLKLLGDSDERLLKTTRF